MLTVVTRSAVPVADAWSKNTCSREAVRQSACTV